MKYFVGLLAVVLLVAAATVGAYNIWDNATQTRDTPGVIGGTPTSARPAAGQVIVTGTITAAHFEGAVLQQLATPFDVTTASRGEGGATFTPVIVAGESSSIEWQAGQPLPVSGESGGLALGPVTIDATSDAIFIGLDGVHGVLATSYTLGSSVAVGSQPRDSVTFTATEQTTVSFRGGANTPLPTPDLTTSGKGIASLEGDMTVTQSDGTSASYAALNFDGGEWTLMLSPSPVGGFAVNAILQGSVH